VFNGRATARRELLKAVSRHCFLSLTSLLHEKFPHPLTYTQNRGRTFLFWLRRDNEKEQRASPAPLIQKWAVRGRGTGGSSKLVSAKSSTIKS